MISLLFLLPALGCDGPSAQISEVADVQPTPAPCPKARSVIKLGVSPAPRHGCVVILEGPAGARHHIHTCESATMVEPGDWTATLYARGQPARKVLIVAEPNVAAERRFGYDVRGGLALGKLSEWRSFTTLDGKSHDVSKGSVPPGVYTIPKTEGWHAVVSAGHCAPLPSEHRLDDETPASIVVAGKRFALDDAVKVVALTDPRG